MPLMLSGLATVASSILVLTAYLRTTDDYLVIDGSNVMFWNGDKPSLDPVVDVVARARAKGLTPVIWFDANVGYRIGDRYLGEKALAQRLGVRSKQVFVAPKGTPADPLLLKGAQDLQARVVTNDQFRDWKSDFPKLADDDFLVHGRFKCGQLLINI